MSTSTSDTKGGDVQLASITKSFGDKTVLHGIDLAVGDGELVALLGPSGCGKTTALRIIAGFEQPSGGLVILGGKDITRQRAASRGIGIVFQAYSLFPHLTASENVAYGLKVRGLKKSERRARAAELLGIVGLSEHKDKYPHELSGGQQQRVALARAFAIEPRVLLLDEPLSALDAKVRVQLRDEIRRLQRERGTTTIMVTHDQEEALTMADRVAVMNAGRIEQLGTPDEVYRRPASPFVAEFVGVVNRLPGVVTASGVDSLGLSLAVDATGFGVGDEVDVLVRPEDLEVRSDESATAVVTAIILRGAMSSLEVKLARVDSPVRVDVSSSTARKFAVGQKVRLDVDHRGATIDVRRGSAR